MPMTVKRESESTYSVRFDANRLEQIASALGFFTDSFKKNIDRAEADYRAGRVRRVKSLSELL